MRAWRQYPVEDRVVFAVSSVTGWSVDRVYQLAWIQLLRNFSARWAGRSVKLPR